MAGRRDGDHVFAVDLEALAVFEYSIGCIVTVERSVGARPDRFQREHRTTDDRRTGPLRKRPRSRAVVAVGMGAHDRGDRAASNRLFEGLYVLGEVRPWIDNRDLALADQIGLRAEISERRRIM